MSIDFKEKIQINFSVSIFKQPQRQIGNRAKPTLFTCQKKKKTKLKELSSELLKLLTTFSSAINMSMQEYGPDSGGRTKVRQIFFYFNFFFI